VDQLKALFSGAMAKTLGRTAGGALVILCAMIQFFAVVVKNNPPQPCYYVAFALVVLAALAALWAVFLAPRFASSNLSTPQSANN